MLAKPAAWRTLDQLCGATLVRAAENTEASLSFSFRINLIIVIRSFLLLPELLKPPRSLIQSYSMATYSLGVVAFRKVFLALSDSPKGQCDFSIPRQDVSHTGPRTQYPPLLLTLNQSLSFPSHRATVPDYSLVTGHS